MKKHFLIGALLAFLGGAWAFSQVKPAPAEGVNPQYRATTTVINELVHTKLDVRFDYAKRYLYGKEWVTVRPHFAPVTQLSLDAKGMDIKTVAVVAGKKSIPLQFKYDEKILDITLDKAYTRGQDYTVYIEYTAKPDEIKTKGSQAITAAKGLYFINPDGTDKEKPIQIWTQGETESSSAWFPTIDKPNQKTTQEISITAPEKYVTLSNGKLVSKKRNKKEGTRTDTWKMDAPHAPYLFMMAVGDFKIYKDTPWKGKPVEYYLEEKYAPYAKQIFGKTPEMMTFYSETLGIDYPWNKYAQVVVRDYVSGAMENTTATIHGAFVQKTDRELLDGDSESIIAHELFHHWFGDYVTAESWSNLTMNESFATLAPILWQGHSRGKDYEDEARYAELNNYLHSTKEDGKSPALARYFYNDKEDVFDNVTYAKGSVILYDLKKQIGDEAFFKGLNKYLADNAYKTTEPQHLRLALEAVSGKDLSQYFNQWWYYGGHPVLEVAYGYADGKATIDVSQVQDDAVQTFTLPIDIDYYIKGKKVRKQILIDQRKQSFSFDMSQEPEFVDFDVDKTLVGEVREEKVAEDYVYQYKYAPSYINRSHALEYFSENKANPLAQEIFRLALKDSMGTLRFKAIDGLDLSDKESNQEALAALLKIAKGDKYRGVRAAAIRKLADTGDMSYKPLMQESLKDRSYSVIEAGLLGLKALDPEAALKEVRALDEDTQKHLADAIMAIHVEMAKDDDYPYFKSMLDKIPVLEGYGEALYNASLKILFTGSYLLKVRSPEVLEQGLKDLKTTTERIGFGEKFKWGKDWIISSLTEGVNASPDDERKAEMQKRLDRIKAILQNRK